MAAPPLQVAQAVDCADWLPNDLLIKLDRCLMAHGTEGRTPYLDTELAALAFRLPDELKVRRGLGKWLLRRWLAEHLPEAQPFARKRGFTVPVARWIARRAGEIGPLVARSPAVREICRPDAVERAVRRRRQQARRPRRLDPAVLRPVAPPPHRARRAAARCGRCARGSRLTGRALRIDFRCRAAVTGAAGRQRGARRRLLRSISGIGMSSEPATRVRELVVALETAAQPAAPGRDAAARVQFERRFAAVERRGDMVPGHLQQRRALQCRVAAAAKGFLEPDGDLGRGEVAVRRATTNDEPGTMRRISAMRWRAFKIARPPAARWAWLGTQ